MPVAGLASHADRRCPFAHTRLRVGGRRLALLCAQCNIPELAWRANWAEPRGIVAAREEGLVTVADGRLAERHGSQAVVTRDRGFQVTRSKGTNQKPAPRIVIGVASVIQRSNDRECRTDVLC